MFTDHYDNWIESRVNGLQKYIKVDYFKSKTLLELGAGHAHIGNKFYKMGVDVTSSDVRIEHINIINQKYPHLKTLLIDGNNFIIDKKYDIILHWGLLYHLNEIEIHLEQISKKCNVLLLETEICDSDDENFYIIVNENGYDQSINNIGIRPSFKYVEKY